MRLLTFILLLTFASAVFCSSEPVEINEKNTYARTILVVPPTHPKQDPAGKSSVEIRLTGIVTTEGVLRSPVFEEREGEEKFVKAIREVLPDWRFSPAADGRACKLRESKGTVSVWFETKNGEPVVSVSALPAEKFTGHPVSPGGTRLEYVRRAKPEYPRAAVVNWIDGVVEMLIKVDREGTVVESTVRYSIPAADFGNSVSYALRRARFTPRGTSDAEPEFICVISVFRFGR